MPARKPDSEDTLERGLWILFAALVINHSDVAGGVGAVGARPHTPTPNCKVRKNPIVVLLQGEAS